MKKIISLLCLTILSIQLFAYDFEVNGIYYNINPNKISVSVTTSPSSEKYSGNIVIPSYVEYDDTARNVTSIGSEAFFNCTDLTNITIPSSVTFIEGDAFSGCTGLVSITIPKNITSIGKRAFNGCTGLKTLNYDADSCGGDGFSYHDYWLKNCDNLEIVNIGENVKVIPDYFFNSQSKIINITIPDSVTSRARGAFWNCPNLNTLTLVKNVKVFGLTDESGLLHFLYYMDTIISLATIPPTITGYYWVNNKTIFEC